MRLAHIFIDRPIFATVLSVFVTLVGLGALAILPVAQYPEIAPPIINITGQYTGASAETVAETVVSPIEQSVNGVEGMLYISSN
jgi:multidrug efflux pump subunit AcrB